MSESRVFFDLCRKIGSKTPNWVQGPGGNISAKITSENRRVLRIKASGYRLDQVSPSQGFVDLDLAATTSKLDQIIGSPDSEEQYAKLLAENVVAKAKSSDRASMETGFHLALSSTYVMHFHSLVALALADLFFKKDPRALKFQGPDSKLKLSFLDFSKPGLELSSAIKAAEPAEAYILRNHGVILAFDEPTGLERWEALEKAIVEEFGWESLIAAKGVEDKLTFWPLAGLMPDTIVFMQKLIGILEEDPKNSGHFRLRQSEAELNPDLKELWFANVKLLSTKPDLAVVPASEWEAIAGMPMEKYRQSLMTKGSSL